MIINDLFVLSHEDGLSCANSDMNEDNVEGWVKTEAAINDPLIEVVENRGLAYDLADGWA